MAQSGREWELIGQITDTFDSVSVQIVNPSRQGFIQAMADADFAFNNAGYNSTIHDWADTGGEVE